MTRKQPHNKSHQYAADGRRTPFTWRLRRHSKVAAVLGVNCRKEYAMYKEFENPLPPKFGRMFVGNDAKLNQGPPRPNDTVTVRAGDSTDFYILVEECSLDLVSGELVGIGPDPRWEYQGWSHGDKIKVPESAVTTIIRAD